MIRRYQKFAARQDIVPDWGPSIAPPTVPARVTQLIDQDEITRKQARARLAEHEGLDTSFVFHRKLIPLRFGGAGGVIAPILNFRVPAGRVLVINRVEYWLSEPMCYGSGQFVWQMSISSAQIPFHQGSRSVLGATSLSIPLDGLGGDSIISPVYVQANELVTIDVIETTATLLFFNEWLTGQATLWGRLMKPTGGA